MVSSGGRLKRFFIEQKCIPWSISHRFELLLERKLHFGSPFLYHLIRYGRLQSICTTVTAPPGHHFFGYYDKTPWSETGGRLLAHQASFNDRPPTADDTVKIGYIDISKPGEFNELATSKAWNWQQGSMLQWDPRSPNDRVYYNDRRNGSYVAIRRSAEVDEETVFDRPLYTISPDGSIAFSLNFSRLQTWRPGYGYAGVPDNMANIGHPDKDGIFKIDLDTGTSKLIVPLEQLASMDTLPGMRDTTHWINHIQVSPDGGKIAFFHIWQDSEHEWKVRFYNCRVDGSELKCILDTGDVSHYDWQDERHILVWAKNPVGPGTHFLLCDVETESSQIFAGELLGEDGHCSYSPDRKWILNDTYPDQHNMRTLMLVHRIDAKVIELDRFYSPKDKWWGEIRCDLHPRWNRDGTQVCVDSVHSGTRQMYLIDLRGII